MGIKLNSITNITINQTEIKLVLRIISVCLVVFTLSFAALFYGIFTAQSYVTVLVCVVLAVYILIPLSFRFCPHLQQSMVFQTNVDAAREDFDKPDGLKGVRNFTLSTQHGINIGLWHMLPSSLSDNCGTKHANYWEESIRLGDHKGIIIYFHGVTGTRGKSHRKELYKVLQSHEYHVISCDYRGFGDSTKVRRINETGVVTDALNVYKWVKNELIGGNDKIPVFIWGHSLGTGISTHLVGKLNEGTEAIPDGLILESPFDNFGEELRNHAKLKIWSRLPFFDSLIVNPLLKNDIAFLSDGHLSKIPVPIMIMHAKDDNVVPSHLGRRLFEIGKQLRQPQLPEAHPIYFVHMTAGKHNEIYKANGDIFTKVVNSFTEACLSLDFEWHKNLPGLDIISSNS